MVIVGCLAAIFLAINPWGMLLISVSVLTVGFSIYLIMSVIRAVRKGKDKYPDTVRRIQITDKRKAPEQFRNQWTVTVDHKDSDIE